MAGESKDPPIEFDEIIDMDRIRQFASQLECLSPEMIAFLGQRFDGQRSAEFYRGLLAGFASAYQLCQMRTSVINPTNVLGALVAYTSSRLEHRIAEETDASSTEPH